LAFGSTVAWRRVNSVLRAARRGTAAARPRSPPRSGCARPLRPPGRGSDACRSRHSAWRARDRRSVPPPIRCP